MSASPFPWASLDSVRRGDLGLVAKMRHASMRVIDLPNAEGALRDLLGPCEVSLRLRRVTSTPLRVEESAVAALIAPGDRADRRRAFAIVIEHALAASIASRALKRAAPRVVDPSARSSPALAGAVAAILVAAARRNALAPLRVISAGPAHAVLGELVAIDAVPIGATFTVLLDHDAYLVHVFAPRSALEPIVDPHVDARALAALGAMPIEVPLVAAMLVMSAEEYSALSPGDAIAPIPSLRVLTLAAPESDVGFGVEITDDGRVVLRDGPHPLIEEDGMVDKDALAQSIGDTPVVVRVDVGSAQMTAREWAALGAGDVIALGKRIGEHVVLRVGGVEVARGELVDVEGEIGVRIVARSGGTVA